MRGKQVRRVPAACSSPFSPPLENRAPAGLVVVWECQSDRGGLETRELAAVTTTVAAPLPVD